MFLLSWGPVPGSFPRLRARCLAWAVTLESPGYGTGCSTLPSTTQTGERGQGRAMSHDSRPARLAWSFFRSVVFRWGRIDCLIIYPSPLCCVYHYSFFCWSSRKKHTDIRYYSWSMLFEIAPPTFSVFHFRSYVTGYFPETNCHFEIIILPQDFLFNFSSERFGWQLFSIETMELSERETEKYSLLFLPQPIDPAMSHGAWWRC